METVVKRAIVPFAKEEIYSIINDVRAYPAYLPFCKEVVILEQSEDGHTTEACMTITLAGIPFSITTRNTGRPHDHMDVLMIQGPFKAFYGEWTLTYLESRQHTLVQFQLSYDLGMSPTTRLVAPIFRMLADHFINAFISRAQYLYGPHD